MRAKHHPRGAIYPIPRRPDLGRPAALASVCVASLTVLAQDAVAPPAPSQPTAVSPPSLGTSATYTGPSAGVPSGPTGVASALKWGPIEAHPHLAYRFSYGDGMQARPGEQLKTAINEISPGIGFALGQHWYLDYTPTLSFYSNDAFEDTTDHRVSLAGGVTYEKWTFGLQQTYASSSSPLVETGAQTDQQTFVSALSASAQLSSRMSIDLGAHQNLRLAQNYPDVWEWSTMDWLAYQVAPRLSFGPGLGFGYVLVDPGTDMTYEQVQGRMSWQVAGKVDLQVNGGIEVRQMLDSGLPELVTPIYGATVRYQPFETTSVSLGLNRVVSPSYYENQVTESTDFHATLTQRLLKRLSLDLGGGYRFGKYVATSQFAPVSREDNYAYFSVRLSTSLLKRGRIGAFYQHSENSSNEGGYSYSSDQVGIDLQYRW